MKNLFSILIAFLAWTSTTAQIFTTEKKEKIQSFISYLEIENQLIGTIAITENGTEVFNNSFGQFNATESAAVSGNPLYQMGSITKMFTAVMLAQLQEKGKISFEEKLSKYYPDMPNATAITLKQMLNHTSGLKDYIVFNDSVTDWLMTPQSQDKILAEIKRQGVLFEPGKDFEYSNSAYYLLARILETKYKKQYAKILEDQIVKPLKLENTFAYYKNSSFNYVELPVERSTGQWQVVKDFHFYNASGVGDIIATPSDLNIFMNAVHSGKLIKKETLESMKPLSGKPFGLGIMTVPFYDIVGFGHGGDTVGTHSVSAYMPQSNIAITYAINGEHYETNDFAIGVLSMLYDKPFTIPVFTNFKATPDLYATFEGTYNTPEFPLDITIFIKDDQLMGQGSGQPSFPLTQIEATKFEFKPAQLTIAFFPKENYIMLSQGGADIKMMRK